MSNIRQYQIKQQGSSYIIFEDLGSDCEGHFGCFATLEEATAGRSYMEKNDALCDLYTEMLSNFEDKNPKYGVYMPEHILWQLIHATDIDYLLVGLQKIKEKYDTKIS